jgi:peptidoglycan/xylan/chitin deacetylase (PgdA/CDA1 family)
VNDLRVALTFDAEHPSRRGSDGRSPGRILDALAAARVRATFFVQGRWASAYPDLAGRIAADGHLVGNHSNSHAPMTLLSADGVRADVREAERRIIEHAGVDPRPWFRCPFGAGEDDGAVREVVTGLGYRIVPWDLDSGDWLEDAAADSVRAGVVRRVDAGPDPLVVLFHTWPEATGSALPGVLAALADRGARFVTVDELDEASSVDGIAESASGA